MILITWKKEKNTSKIAVDHWIIWMNVFQVLLHFEVIESRTYFKYYWIPSQHDK